FSAFGQIPLARQYAAATSLRGLVGELFQLRAAWGARQPRRRDRDRLGRRGDARGRDGVFVEEGRGVRLDAARRASGQSNARPGSKREEAPVDLASRHARTLQL